MSREWFQFLEDIVDACRKVMRYTAGLSLEAFREDSQVFDAVVLNLLIVGEAAKHLPDEARQAMPGVAWSHAARFRDLVAHHYYILDPDLVWEIASRTIPAMAEEVIRYMQTCSREA